MFADGFTVDDLCMWCVQNGRSVGQIVQARLVITLRDDRPIGVTALVIPQPTTQAPFMVSAPVCDYVDPVMLRDYIVALLRRLMLGHSGEIHYRVDLCVDGVRANAESGVFSGATTAEP